MYNLSLPSQTGKSLILGLFLFLICPACFGSATERSDNSSNSSLDYKEAVSQRCCGEDQETEADKVVDSSPNGILSQNFGTVRQGETVEWSFKLDNQSSEPALLKGTVDHNFPCCLEVVSTVPTELPPNGQTDVELIFETLDRAGPIDIFISLPYEGGAVPKTLHLGGVVRPELVLRPRDLDFRETDEITFTIEGEGLFSEYDIVKLENTISNLSFEEISKEEHKVTYLAKWNSDTPQTNYETVILETTHPIMKQVGIAVVPPGVVLK